ncbi:hypothetical protein IHE45_20G007500 [Dioscorea alata]|uniref:Uncharacterized protein n=1 Tax=Dioscorea alata TaxID=55571 RepID=A0ACB7TPY8_DIOAL|nr:hypothetical protein IHE45_20G007500 [Dioscorea alata]
MVGNGGGSGNRGTGAVVGFSETRAPPIKQMATQEKTDTRAKWNENHRAHLMKLLGDYNVPAYRSQNGWTKEAWNRILLDMLTKFPNLILMYDKA